MPLGYIPISRPLQPLHVYRHMLREVSYLPAVCQPFVRQRISEGFRNAQEKHAKLRFELAEYNKTHKPQRDEAEVPIEDLRAKNALLRGDTNLKVLRAANSGDTDRMRRVMLLAFGRVGKRRRELMSELVRPEPPTNWEELEKRIKAKDLSSPTNSLRNATTAPVDSLAPVDDVRPAPDVQNRLQDGITEPDPWNQKIGSQVHTDESGGTGAKPTSKGRSKKSTVLKNWDIPKLMQYVKSQAQHQAQTSVGIWPRMKVNHRMTIPEKNIWGRPTPQKVALTMKEKWWKTTADKLMPPVGQSEWELLKSLALGQAAEAEWRSPPRRPVALTLSADDSAQPELEWDWKLYASRPVRAIERKRSRPYMRLNGERDNGPFSRTEQRNLDGLTGRELQREFTKVWAITSYIQQDPQTSKKSFVWGRAITSVPPATPVEAYIFQGVDAKGSLPRVNKPR